MKIKALELRDVDAMRKRGVSVMILRKKRAMLLALLLLLSCVFSGIGFASEGGSAPLNPEFVRWRQEISNQPASEASSGFKRGVIPSPVDWSRLGKASYRAVENRIMADPLPAKFDLRDVGGADYVTPVKDQDPYGTCWTFGTLSSLESTQLMSGSLIDDWSNDLSEMQLAWYTYAGDDPIHFTRIGNPEFGSDYILDQGGNFDMTSAFLTRPSGPTDETSCPYDTVPPTGTYSGSYPRRLLVNEVSYLYMDKDTSNRGPTIAAMKDLIKSKGVVAVNYHAPDDLNEKNNYWNDATNAYYCDDITSTNHAVSVVGWDDDFAVNNFVKSPPGKGAWLVKNSWGTSWGDSGYFWLSYYDSSLSMIALYEGDEADLYSDIYLYDPLGYVWSWGYLDVNSMWAANIFTAEKDEQIEAVAFYTEDANLEYEVRVYTGVTAGNPASGARLGGDTRGTHVFAGYHTVRLAQPARVKAGDRFSVVVNIKKKTGAEIYFPIECVASDYSDEASANPGESYFNEGESIPNTWIDLTTRESSANFCIRALVNPIPATGVTVEPGLVELAPDKEFKLSAIVTPPDAADKTVTWSSSDPSIVEVTDTSSGLVKAKIAGEATITATANGAARGTVVTGTAVIKVSAPDIEANGVEISPSDLPELIAGQTRQLTARVSPQDASNKSVGWSSDNETVATVSPTGLVSAVGSGSATITATALGTATAVADTVTVTVAAPAVQVTGVAVTTKTLSIAAGGRGILTASVSPNNASVKDVVWTTSDASIARVDAEGTVTGVSAGVTTVIAASASDPSKNDRATITVTGGTFVSVTSITLTPTDLSLETGESEKLTADVAPANASDKSVRWESSQPSVAAVTQDGRISALSAGTATITATAEGADPSAPAKAAATVTVTGDDAVLVESISVTPSLTVESGKSAELSITFTPDDATNKELDIVSSNPGVATVSGRTVAGVTAGSAVITVTALGGVNVQAKVGVTVTAPPSPPAQPVNPTNPVNPPADPADPTEPATPPESDDPADPTEPNDPSDPVDPSTPISPTDPEDSENTDDSTTRGSGSGGSCDAAGGSLAIFALCAAFIGMRKRGEKN